MKCSVTKWDMRVVLRPEDTGGCWMSSACGLVSGVSMMGLGILDRLGVVACVWLSVVVDDPS